MKYRKKSGFGHAVYHMQGWRGGVQVPLPQGGPRGPRSGSTSGHFARMFGSGMTECSSGEVEVEGYEKEEVEQFIKFLYSRGR